MSTLTEFGRVRIGGHYPAVIDVEEHPADRLLASVELVTMQARATWEGQIVMVLRKHGTVGLFVSYYPDGELPEWWRDAEVLLEHHQPPDVPEVAHDDPSPEGHHG